MAHSQGPIDGQAKSVGIAAIVVSVAKFVNIFLKVSAAYAMELAEHAALEQSPKTFNGVGVNVPIHIGKGVFDDFMGQKTTHARISLVFIGHQLGLRHIHLLSDEGAKIFAFQLILRHSLGRHLAVFLAFNDPDNRSLGCSPSALRFVVVTVVLLALAWFSADINFIHFNDSAQKVVLLLLEHGLANLHGNPPSRVFVDFKIAGKLESGYALFCVKNQ